MLPFVFAASAQAQGPAAVNPQVAPTNPVVSVDPRVPRAAGQPCVVELLHQRPWPQQSIQMDIDPNITYMPPASCPPPWAKIILKIDMRTTQRSVVETLGMDLAGVRLFRSAAPHYNGLSRWHVERDLTDYSALFREPHAGSIWSAQNSEAIDWGWDQLQPIYNADAQLLFYPASAATPAPRVPDAVVGIDSNAPVALPHNIVRAYLDVEADYLDNPFWYTCVGNVGNIPLGDVLAPGGLPKETINAPVQGCGGGSFREIKIAVDGTAAGIAPAFPRVVADLNWWYHRNSADLPIPTLEMLNFRPYRVDLTPFAAILSAAGPHSVTADNPPPSPEEGPGGAETLLLYLDRGRNQVTGTVTLNTLATEKGTPSETNTLKRAGLTTRGHIKTGQHRDFKICGCATTSHGRIDSCVHQTSQFHNVQAFHLEGPSSDVFFDDADKLYDQNIELSNTVQQTSSRVLGKRLIAWDRTSTSYPLQMIYSIATHVTVDAGWIIDFKRTNVTVLQSRVVDGDHYRPGLGHFTTHAVSRFYSVNKGGSQQPVPRWASYTTSDYRDNFGSCHHGELGASNGAIVHLAKGTTCPEGRNWVRWFTHPDGSPDTLGWWR
ncbi:peptide-N4-asparagine amidase [Rhodanobacter umsongensis]|uniref:Peptide-N4-asparagine amidase n=1 Tax=Rhodanobacter umsongensis TaxID=633153 RepID=A0ABW0JHP8_9GAMM